MRSKVYPSPEACVNMPTPASQLRTLTLSEFRLRDQGTFLGFLWTLLHPLLLFGVLWAVFGAWMGSQVPGFTGYLLVGVVFWNFLANATAVALTALERRKGLVLHMNLPRRALVAAAVGSILLSHALELGLLVPLLAVLGHAPGPSLLLLPAVAAGELGIALGAGLLLCGLHVHARDVERIWSLMLTVLFFATPVFYPLDFVGPRYRDLLWLNPATAVLACGRHALLGTPASPWAWALLAGWAAGALALGLAAFRRLARDAAELL